MVKYHDFTQPKLMTNLWYGGVAIFQAKTKTSLRTHLNSGATVGFALSDEYIQQGIESRFTSNIYTQYISNSITDNTDPRKKTQKTHSILRTSPVSNA